MAVLSMQKQPNLSRGFGFRNQRPSQAIFLINCSFINARPNGSFIKAEATKWPDLLISATNCNFAIIPHNQLISGRAKLFLAKASPMAVSHGRFIKAEAAELQDSQI